MSIIKLHFSWRTFSQNQIISKLSNNMRDHTTCRWWTRNWYLRKSVSFSWFAFKLKQLICFKRCILEVIVNMSLNKLAVKMSYINKSGILNSRIPCLIDAFLIDLKDAKFIVTNTFNTIYLRTYKAVMMNSTTVLLMISAPGVRAVSTNLTQRTCIT